MEAVETITREELKEKMDRGDEFVLLETMGEDAYRQMHLPGARSASPTRTLHQRSYRTGERRS